MTIQVHIQINGESGGDIANDLKSLLSRLTGYSGEPMAGTAISTGTVTSEQTNDTPRPTASQRKAAEKAAKEAAEAAAKAAQQAISTGEERVDPEADKQDAKDEAAETAKEKAADPVKLTHDDVKKMLGVYVQMYGMEAAQADGEGFIGCKKISEIPDTQAALAAAVLGIANGIEKNPKSRDVAGELDPEKLAALKPVVAAAKAVK